MEFHTFGNKEDRLAVLVHGMLTPWQIWEKAAERFSKEYYVIVPELDAHTENEPSSFESIEDEAQIIKSYIMENADGKISLLCGLSMGGRIAATLAGLPEKQIPYYLKIADNMELESIDKISDSVFSKFEFKKYENVSRILFMHGTKGTEAVSKKAANKMKEINSQTEIRCFKGYAHAELLCFKEDEWISEVNDWAIR